MPTPYPLGRRVEHDPRNRHYPYQLERKVDRRRSVTHRRRIPIFDQGSLGSCTGNAVAGRVATDDSDRSGSTTPDQHLAVALYSEGTRLDPFDGQWPPTDTGSSNDSVCKAAKRRGLIKSYRWAFSFRDALDAIYETPVVVGVPWYERMFTPLDSGYVEIGGDIVGGHAFLIRGNDPRKQHVLCDQSWGYDWGRRGRFWLRYQILERLLDERGDCTVIDR